MVEQWKAWFDAWEASGMVKYFFVYDDSVRIWKTGANIGLAERKFINEQVDRFEGYTNLV